MSLSTEAHLSFELKTFMSLLPHLLQLHWAALPAPRDSAGFITSDSPVSLSWSDPTMNASFYPPGFGLTGTVVTFPLSKEVLLLGAFEFDSDGESEIDDHQVANLNGTTILNSDRQIFARDGDFRYRLGPREQRGVDLVVESWRRKRD